MPDSVDQPDSTPEAPSRTQVKLEMLALQKLGEELITLTPNQLKKIPLPEDLLDAVQIAQKMTKRRALYRQRQFIGRVMRHIDAAPIQAALDELRQPDRVANAKFHRIESWRDRLLDDMTASTAFIEEYPQVDRQQLGQKIRAARKEQETGKPAGAGRALFRFITTQTTPISKQKDI